MRNNKNDISQLERLKQAINESLKRPILSSEYDLTTADMRRPIDAISENDLKGSTINPGLPLSHYKSEILTHMRRCLGHISANPTAHGNVEALKQIYVTPIKSEDDKWEGALLTGDNVPDINKSTKRIGAFAEELAQIAQENRFFYEKMFTKPKADKTPKDVLTPQKGARKRCRIFLIGRRGSGKTIFLNYLLSPYDKLFREKKVVWIRIDLAKGNFDLQSWMQWQFLYVVFRYYGPSKGEITGISEDPINKELDLTPDNAELMNYILANALNPKILKQVYQNVIIDWMSRIRSSTNVSWDAGNFDSDQSVILPVSTLFQGVWDYLTVAKKVGILFIIDSLDKLGLTPEDEKEYQRKINNLKNYIFHSNTLPAAYLITMRYESYIDVRRTVRDVDSCLFLEDISPYAIYEKRLHYIGSGNALLSNSLVERGFEDLEEYHKRLKDVCELFLKYVTISITKVGKYEETTDPKIGLEILDNVFNKDLRTLSHALQQVLNYFFRNMIENFEDSMLDALSDDNLERLPKIFVRKYYLFIEALMLGKHSYHLRHYGHNLTADGHDLVFERLSDAPGYLPNIYSHPRYEGFRGFHGLSGTRILQCLRYGIASSKNSVLQLLSDRFGYDKRVVEAQLKEMLVDHTIAYERAFDFQSKEQLEITARGNFVLDRLVGNPEYTSLAIHTVCVPRDLIDKGYFKIVGANKNKRHDFVKCKVINTIDFLRLLQLAENDEERRFNESTGGFGPSEDYVDVKEGALVICEAYKKRVLTAIFAILDRAWEHGHNDIIEPVLKHFEDEVAKG